MWYQLELWKGWEAKVSTWVVTCVYTTTFPTRALDTTAQESLLVGNTACIVAGSRWHCPAPQGEGGWQPHV